jgi:hypothetical protein
MSSLPAGASRFSVLELRALARAPDKPPDPMENDQLRLARLLIPPSALLIPGRSKLDGRLVEYPAAKSPDEMGTPLQTIPALARVEEGIAIALLPVAVFAEAPTVVLVAAAPVLLVSALAARMPQVCGDRDNWGQLCVPTEHMSLSGTKAHTWFVWRSVGGKYGVKTGILT